MPKQIKKRLSVIKLFLISTFSFLLTACEEIVLNIKDEDTGIQDSGSCASSDHCKIFVTDSQYDGNIGGSAGGDAICMSDTNYPGTGTYKAMLVDSSRSGNPLSQSDWVLQASKEYRRLDGITSIGTTSNEAIFALSYGSPLSNTFSATVTGALWTGLYGQYDNWTTSYNCNNWTANSSGITGRYGAGYAVTSSAVDYGPGSCNVLANIICIQQ